MQQRPPAKPDAEVLPDRVATRLLERASELDAAQRAGAAVSDLRAAAAEAGISARAFDAALDELHDAQQVEPPRSGTRRRALVLALALVAALIASVVVSRLFVQVSVATVEQTFQLRCLSPTQVAELLRPVIDPNTTMMRFSPRAPGTVTIRTTPEQLRSVRSLLEQQDAAGSATCAAPARP